MKAKALNYFDWYDGPLSGDCIYEGKSYVYMWADEAEDHSRIMYDLYDLGGTAKEILSGKETYDFIEELTPVIRLTDEEISWADAKDSNED